MNTQSRPSVRTLFSALACLALLCGCRTAKVTHEATVGPTPKVAPPIVYVADFELDAADVHSEKGFLPAPPKLPGLGDHLPAMPGSPQDPKELAARIVRELNEKLVQELIHAGWRARRQTPGAALPASGWLVRGVLTQVNQGHHLSRAVIGFGKGKTEVQAVVDVCDLSLGAPQKFYEFGTSADSGKAPGAGPSIVLGPAGLAARFMITAKDLDRNVSQTAARIAEQVTRRLEQPSASGQLTSK